MTRRAQPASARSAGGLAGAGSLAGPAALSSAAALWGGMYVVSKVILDRIPPWVLLEMRFVLGLLALGAVAGRAGRWRVRREDLPVLAALGLVGYTGSIGTQFLGIELSGAALGSLLTTASPAFIALFAWRILREPLDARKVAALFIASAGVVAVIGLPGESSGGMLRGNLFLLGAAVAWALYTVMGRLLTREGLSPLTVTLWANLFGVLFTAPIAAWQWSRTSFSLPTEPLTWTGVLYLGVLATAAAFYLWNKGFEYVQPSTGSLYLFVQPLVGGALGAALLGERLSPGFFVGAVLIVSAIYLSASGRGSAAPERVPQQRLRYGPD